MTARKDFPLYDQKLTASYLDSACMTQICRAAYQAQNDFYLHHCSCHGRSDYSFGRQTTAAFNQARAQVAKLIGAGANHQIIFTKNTTEAINLVAKALTLTNPAQVLTSDREHSSNFLPWQRGAQQEQFSHEVFKSGPQTSFCHQHLVAKLTPSTRLVAVSQTSNISGVTWPIAQIAQTVAEHGAWLLVDAAQAITCCKIDVTRDQIDFLAFSGHKAFGPTGTGVLCVKKERLQHLAPFLVGGETIEDFSLRSQRWADAPARYEAGLQNYAGFMGLGAAAAYIQATGTDQIAAKTAQLNAQLRAGLSKFSGIELIGTPEPAAITNFIAQGIDAFELARLLDQTAGIMVRAGFHCAHAYYHTNNLPPSLRVSFQVYNRAEEVERLLAALQQFLTYFR